MMGVAVITDPVLVNDWHPIVREADIPEKQIIKARLLGEDLIVWRTGSEVRVWQDLCIHRGTPLSIGRIDGDRVVCAYHGWEYDTNAQCVRIPAHPDQVPPTKARVRSYEVCIRYGLVWASLGKPRQEVPDFLEWDDPSFRKIPCGPYIFNASGPRAIENFVDVAHFPILHEGLLGDQNHAEIEDYEVELSKEGIRATDIRVWQPNPDGTGIGAELSYTYHLPRPFTVYFRKVSGGPYFSMFYALTPIDTLKCAGWGVIALNYDTGSSDDEVRAFEDYVFNQDIPVVEAQHPELLPLDLQAELHLRSDRIAIVYRKWLRELGVSFGTS
jgi:phenylpropionate dioxygenase-like ring-hydroxylating dioxygenase large terminal subunit